MIILCNFEISAKSRREVRWGKKVGKDVEKREKEGTLVKKRGKEGGNRKLQNSDFAIFSQIQNLGEGAYKFIWRFIFLEIPARDL